MIIKYIKDFWMDILNFMLVLFLSSISFYLLKEGNIEETKVLISVFVVSLVFMNIRRFDVIKNPFLTAELRESTAGALAIKKELDTAISESKDAIKKLEEDLVEAKNIAIMAL
jgi:hypothetical protein